MAINILDSMIINRISAGEVVESPFSIVKELIDNSLDAGATKIYVEIKNGGIDKIVVKDNGNGIDYDDIKKAFLPHATSKINDLDDLNEIMTLGFRGEALASISNVSQTNLVTKTRESDCAYCIDVNGGNFGEIQGTSSDDGTRIEVKNLFYNTPARRKFLKKPKQEENQITNIISRYILSNPNINFKYVVDEKIVYQTRGKSLLDALCCVYGDEITQNIMPVEKYFNNMKLSGYVSKVGFSKPNTSYQTLIINKRFVTDEIVSKAVYMAFEEYLMTRQFPFFVLNLTMPSVDVDVNVHPSKMNVKFSNPSKVYELVYTAVRSAIYQFINPNKGTPVEIKEIEKPSERLIKTDLNSLKEIEIEPTVSDFDNSKIKLKQESFVPITMFDLKKEIDADKTDKKENLSNSSYFSNNNTINSDILNTLNIGKNQDSFSNLNQPSNKNLTINKNENSLNDLNDFKNVEDFSDFKIIGELFNEFLILEKNDTMILLDFHAGHERLNYDKFTKMVEKRDVVIQDLLIPYTQEMSEQEVDFILNLKDDLAQLGFDIDSFGEKKIVINSVPLQLKDINLKNFVDDLIHDMKNLKPSFNNEIKHYLMQKACKSSVKSGMKLSEMEINELLKNLDINHPVLLCPHGRPVITVISRSQIEKWFKRIV